MSRFPLLFASFFVVVMLSCPAFVAAQTRNFMSGDIMGQVRIGNDTPAPAGAMILLERTDGGVVAQAQTDSQGKFQFHGLDRTAYRITVQLNGYEPSQTEVELRDIAHSYVQIKLRPTSGSAHKRVEKNAPSVVSARDAQISSAAVAEFDKGKKLLLEGGTVDKSIPHFTKAIKIYNKFTQAYILLGVAYRAEQKRAEAGSAFRKAIETDANAAPAYIGLASVQNDEEDFAGAETSLITALKLDPESADAHLELARTYWEMGRWQDADPHAARAIQLQPGNAEAHVIMGNILLRKRNGEGALHEFKESLRLDPKGPLAPATEKMVLKIEAAMKDAKHNQH